MTVPFKTPLMGWRACPILHAAHHFLAGHARVLDLRRFERLFLDGDAEPIRAAVAAYRNADGGFGQALEPDGRTPHSQPPAVEQALRFLEAVPDRARAVTALGRAEAAIHAVVTLDPDAPGEIHGPLAFAPRPDSVARPLFDDATIAAHLDHLAAGQLQDGGWTVNFPAWSPAAGADWRGVATVDALQTLRENGRPVLD